MSDVLTPMTNILVPGRGLVNLDALRVDEAVKEYDERLAFGYNPVNQDWVVYIKLPRDYEGATYSIDNEPVMPVLGFQDRIPHPQEATRRLYETDAWRNGEAIYNRMLEHNDKLKAERNAAYEAEIEEAGDRMAHAYNKLEGDGSLAIYFQNVKRRKGYNIGKRR